MVDVKKALERVRLNPLPIEHTLYCDYLGKNRSFEFLGFLSLGDGTYVTPYTLGKEVSSGELECLTDGESLNVLNTFAIEKWGKKYALAPHAALLEIAKNSHMYPQLFNEVKGVRMLTNTVALRKNGMLELGYIPFFGEDGEIKEFLNGKVKAKIDGEGNAYYVGRDDSWFAPDNSESKHNATYSSDSIHFYPRRDGVHLPEASVSIVITDDKKTHVFSNNSLSHRDVTTRFPIVKL